VSNTTVLDVRSAADRLFSERRFEEALALHLCVLAQEPDHLDARLRVADGLLALGDVQRAAVVYTTLARHTAHAGYPLRALTAIHVLTALEPQLMQMVRAVAELYAADVGRTGRGARPLPAVETAELAPEVVALGELRGEALRLAAEEHGKDLSRCRMPYPDVLPRIPLLSELGQEDFARVFETVTLVRKGAGDAIIVQGEPGQSFFLVARGDLEVVREDAAGARTQLATLGEGAVFGEMALLSRQPRTAHVLALSDVELLELHVEALGNASSGVENIARALGKFTRERLIKNLLTTAPMFKLLDRTQGIDLVRRFVAHEVAAATDIIREGEPGRGLFVVLMGSVDVWKRDGDEKILLATLSPGEVFGEISLLAAQPATATVTAAQRSTVLFLAREYVERLMANLPALRAYLETLGDERAMETRMWLDAGSQPSGTDDDIEIDLEEAL
jgi:cAMP-dependent protein kinase regulator